MILQASRMVTPDGVLDDGWVRIEHGLITERGSGRETGPLDARGAWLLPGFVDLHMHGGGGADVTRGSAAMADAVAFHRRHGTTRTLVSLPTQPVDRLFTQLADAAELTVAGAIEGVHLEGPFLAAGRSGAQSRDDLLAPSTSTLRSLLDAGRGCVRMMTLAPELPGAIELVRQLVDAGGIAAVGHTDATYEQATGAFAAGASVATHLFNAMPPVDRRSPGAALAALDAGVTVEVINDGVHVHDALVRLAAGSRADVALVTDAIAATGTDDGTSTLGGQAVTIRDGHAHLGATTTLAGSTLTMDAAVRRAVRTVGLPIEVASAAASTTPARALGLADRTGAIAAGLDADLVVLDDELHVVRVMARGEWVPLDTA